MTFTGEGLAFSPDGTRLAYTSMNTVKTYTVNGWTAGTTLLNGGGSDYIFDVGFTPNGQQVVSATSIGFAGGDVFVHNFGTALPAITKRVPDEPWSFAVSPRAAADGSVAIAVGGYYATMQVLTLTDSQLTGPIVLPASTTTMSLTAASFSLDGTLLAVGEDYGAIRFWRLPLMTSNTPIAPDNLVRGRRYRRRPRVFAQRPLSRGGRRVLRGAAQHLQRRDAHGGRPHAAGGQRQYARVLTQRRRDHRRPR